MTIDWSKAPEGATHWDPIDGNYLKQICGLAFMWYGGGTKWGPKTWQYPEDLSTMPRLIARPAAWNGEGLPPVGVKIEISHKNAQPDWANPGFRETKIVAMGEQLMILEPDGSGHEKVAKIADYHFRPLRTPEQIAAEERQKEIDGMVYEMMRSRTGFGTDQTNAKEIAIGYAEQLHKSGYRKQVAP